MYYKAEFETVIREHYVCKSSWTPVIGGVLECVPDTRAEAQEHDNAIGLYLETKQDNKTLAVHVSIELSRLLKNFLEANKDNKLFAQVTGKRKRGRARCIGKVLGLNYGTTHCKNSEERELDGRAAKHGHFKLRNIVRQENNFQGWCRCRVVPYLTFFFL